MTIAINPRAAWLVTFACLFSILATPLFAQGTELSEPLTFPDTVRGERMAEFFAAYQSGDREDYARWLQDNRTQEFYDAAPLDARLDLFEEEMGMWGGLIPVEMEEADTDTIGIYAQQANSGRWMHVTFTFDPDDDNLIGPMNIQPAGGPGVMRRLNLDWATLHDLAVQIREQTGVPAVALGMYRNGEILDQTVLGERMVGSGDMAELDDTFHWGSLGKAVTGTVLAALVDEGVIDWNDTLEALLPDVPMRDVYRTATISQIMSHQAGIPTYTNFTPEMVELMTSLPGTTNTERRAAFVAHLLQEVPVGAPGEVGEYSNAGIALGGYIAEHLTGRSWRELVQTYVFDRAGMTTAGFDWPYSEERPEQPHGHFTTPQGIEPTEMEMFTDVQRVIEPAGNIRSSVGDMLRFAALHLDGLNGRGTDFDPQTIQRLHSPQPGATPVNGEVYTFGWGHSCPAVPPQIRCEWHNGSAGSFYAALMIFPDRDLALAYMANTQGQAALISDEVFMQMLIRNLN